MQMYSLKLLLLCKTKWLNLCVTVYGLGKFYFNKRRFRVNVKITPSFVVFKNNRILLKSDEIC